MEVVPPPSRVLHAPPPGRQRRREVINLGFSGNGKLDTPLAAVLAEIDAGAYILDCLPNLDPEGVAERTGPFVESLLGARPDTPVILVEDHPRMSSWLKPDFQQEHEEKWQAFKEVYQKLLDSGFKNLHYVKGDKLFGTDNEASMDGVHPSDLGYMRMADIMEEAMRKALAG